MSYRVALERLLAFEPKRLVRMRYWDGTCGCYIGVTCPVTRGLHIVPRWSLSAPKPGGGFISWADLVGEAGLSVDEANAALDENDAFVGTDEGRYRHMVNWTRKRLAQEEQLRG